VNGILFDLGMSSLQLEAPGRGFSFQQDSPLDMRFSSRQPLTAADIVNTYPEHELVSLLEKYGEERRGRQIAKRIVESRPLRTTFELVQVVEQAVGGVRGRIHPATKTFQALRIAVNQELESLELALRQALDLLGSGGRIAVISFQSLEDRLVKEFLRRESQGCLCPPSVPVCVCGHTPKLRIVTKKAVRPSPAELQANPRSRSAKMRVGERI
jgi:16S rRNA (cytosine1402-N4)-methyltransferase